jgi:hypothetical protein
MLRLRSELVTFSIEWCFLKRNQMFSPPYKAVILRACDFFGLSVLLLTNQMCSISSTKSSS